MRLILTPYWKDEHTWVCPRHLPSAVFSEKMTRCWYARCPSERPPKPGDSPPIFKEAPPQIEEAPPQIEEAPPQIEEGPSKKDRRRGATVKVLCKTCGCTLWRRTKDVEKGKEFYCFEHRLIKVKQ